MVGRATEGSARGTEPEVFVSEDTVGTSEGPDPDHGSAEKGFIYYILSKQKYTHKDDFKTHLRCFNIHHNTSFGRLKASSDVMKRFF